MYLLLWILAIVLIVYGVKNIIEGSVLVGILLILLGLLVGPGGVSIFS